MREDEDEEVSEALLNVLPGTITGGIIARQITMFSFFCTAYVIGGTSWRMGMSVVGCLFNPGIYIGKFWYLGNLPQAVQGATFRS